MYLTLMLGRNNFIMYIPLVITAYLTTGHFLVQKIDEYGANGFLGKVKELIKKGNENRHWFREIRADLEVYIALYLTAKMVIGLRFG